MKESVVKFNRLSQKEKEVIENKGTEKPFSGEYNDFFDKGVYYCRKCESPLYTSKSKFRSKCGWPSFDDEIPGAVKRQTDADGMRTEITCATCDAHLGHVFTGEKYTKKDTRHCVNSLSLKFKSNVSKENEIAVFGGGCFWCTEAVFARLAGVEEVVSGYAGGKTRNPLYEEVSTGKTCHAEVIQITFDPTKISYNKLLEIFFFIHDPTTKDRQGNDRGTQYRSIILTTTNRQKYIADKYIAKLKKKGTKVVTEVRKLRTFYPAKEYHQKYFEKNKGASYCSMVIVPKLKKFEEKFQDLLK